MEQFKLGEMEQKFANLIWEREPVASGRLVELCGEEFCWKKSTTYTMLKRLCDRGIFENKGGAVRAVIKKQDFHAMQGEQLIRESFGGSLPRFLAAFTRRNRLSAAEIQELTRLIEGYGEE